MKEVRYNASGKLLLFGEYLVLRGAESLAIPLSARQTLTLSVQKSSHILWRCFERESVWLEVEFSKELEIIKSSDAQMAYFIQKLLKLIETETGGRIKGGEYFRFDIDFDRKWGFGTSSTLISLLSQWSGVDPYFLLEHSFGGSGFDVACATAYGPIVYKANGVAPEIKRVPLSENVTHYLLFVYTGQKQLSSREVERFGNLPTTASQINQMNKIVTAAAKCEQIEEFEKLMITSEELLSGILKAKPVKRMYFDDYPYAVKSLGAWGGDFVMATYRDLEEAKSYFKAKNLNYLREYQHIIKRYE